MGSGETGPNSAMSFALANSKHSFGIGTLEVRDYIATMTAPVASGWSGCRVGLAPTGKRRLSTAHTQSGHRRG
jgi:hypothetical protein